MLIILMTELIKYMIYKLIRSKRLMQEIRRKFTDDFKKKVAISIDVENPNFQKAATLHSITSKQAKAFWLDYQAKLNANLLSEIKLLKFENRALKAKLDKL